MRVIVCLDDNGGMLFNCRRQSRDRVVVDDILSVVGEKRLYIAPFSEKLFAERSDKVTVSEDMLFEAEADQYCFVEKDSLSECSGRIEEMVIYRWNRVYPADLFLDVTPERIGLSLFSTEELTGYSHEKITKEIFKK